MTIGPLLGLLAVIAGLLYRNRVQRLRDQESAALSDAMIRQIEERGSIDVDDEPLDLTTIQEEEARFWEEERWDEAEEI